MSDKGPWSQAQVRRFLEATTIPVRIACNAASGHPLLVSLWFVPIGDRLWCATQRTATAARLLGHDPRCAFEVSVETPPYRGVRGPALAKLHDDRGEEILRTLIDRYLGDSSSRLARILLERVEDEVAIEIQPLTLVSWDYEKRMGDPA